MRVRKMLELLPPWLLSGVTLAAILWLTLAPRPLGEVEIPLFPGADKLVHAVMFGGFAAMILLDRRRRDGWRLVGIWPAIAAAAVSVALGALTEWGQDAADAGRSGDTADLLADAAGACVVAAAYWLATKNDARN